MSLNDLQNRCANYKKSITYLIEIYILLSKNLESFNDDKNKFGNWINETEKKILDTQPATSPNSSDLKSHSDKLSKLAKDINDKRNDLNKLKSTSKKIMDDEQKLISAFKDLKNSPLNSEIGENISKEIDELDKASQKILQDVKNEKENIDEINKVYDDFISRWKLFIIWLTSKKLKINEICEKPTENVDADKLKDQLNDVKAHQNEFIEKRDTLDNLKKDHVKLKQILEKNNLQPSDEIVKVDENNDEFKKLLDSVESQIQKIEVSSAQSQQLQDTLNDVTEKINEVERKLKKFSSPSLNTEKMTDQINENQKLISELLTIDAIIQSLKEKNPNENKLKKIEEKYVKINLKVNERDQELKNIQTELLTFNEDVDKFTTELEKSLENLDIEKDMKIVKQKVKDLEQTGKNLTKKKVDDSDEVTRKLKTIKELYESLKQKLNDLEKENEKKNKKLKELDEQKNKISIEQSKLSDRILALNLDALKIKVIDENLKNIEGLKKDHDKLKEPIKKFTDLGNELKVDDVNKIGEKHSEIEKSIDDKEKVLLKSKTDVQNVEQNLQSLKDFLNDFKKQTPKISIEDVESAQKVKGIATNLSEKLKSENDKLKSTEAQVQEIIKDKESTPDAQNLDKNVKDLSNQFDEQQKSLDELAKLSENGKEFWEIYLILITWLKQRENLFATLGPAANDPKMAKTQIDQIKVLKEDSKEDQLKKLKELSEKFDAQSSKPVLQKLDELEKNIMKLDNQLNDKENRLVKISEVSVNFDDDLNKIQNNLQKINDDVTKLSSPDVQEKLEKLGNLKNQLENEKSSIEDVDKITKELCKLVDDSNFEKEISTKIQNLRTTYKNIDDKLKKIKDQEDENVAREKEIVEKCTILLTWVKNLSTCKEIQEPISAKKSTLEKQFETFEKKQREIQDKENEIESLKNEKNEPAEAIKNSWKDLKENSSKYQNRLRNAFDLATKQENLFNNLDKSINEMENQSSPQKCSKKSDVDNKISTLDSIERDIAMKKPELDQFVSKTQELLDSTDTEKEVVDAEKQKLIERWNKLNEKNQNELKIFRIILQKLSLIDEKLRQTNSYIQKNQSTYDALQPKTSPKSIEKLRFIVDDLQEIEKKNLSEVQDLLKDFKVDANDNFDDHELIDEIKKLSDKSQNLKSQIENQLEKSEGDSKQVQKLKDDTNAIKSDVNDLEKEVEKPTEVEEVKKLSEKTNGKIKEIDGVFKSVSDLENNKDFSNGEELADIRQQLDDLKQKCLVFIQRLKDTENDINNKEKEIAEFYENLKKIGNELDEVDGNLNKNRDNSPDSDKIKSQLQFIGDLKVQVVEPVEKKVLQLSSHGNNLVKASNPTKIPTLEKDIAEVEEKLNKIKNSISDRNRELDSALLNAGKLEEVLHGLLKWIEESEEMAKLQKSPSIEQNVLKAQIQEQKFLIKMIEDNEKSFDMISSQKGQDPAVKDLRSRFDILKENAKKRMDLLEKAVVIAKKFDDQLDSTSENLKKFENKFNNVGKFTVDENQLAKNSEEQTALNDELEKVLKPQVSQLNESINDIKQFFEPEETKNAEDKISEVNQIYQQLLDSSNKSGTLLIKIREIVIKFGKSCDDFELWCDESEKNLQKFNNVPSNEEALQAQIKELNSYQQNIEPKSKELQDISTSSNEIVSNLPNDEVFKIKARIDLLTKRLNNINNLTSENLSRYNNGNKFANDFVTAQKTLEKWIIDAEKVLNDQSIVGKLDNVTTLETEIEPMRSQLETIKTIGPQFGMLLPKEESIKLEENVNKINKQFESTVEKIQRTSERYKIILQRSEEISNNVDETLNWFRYIENVLANAADPSIEPDISKEQLINLRKDNDEILRSKGRVKEIISSTQKISRDLQIVVDDYSTFRDKLDELKNVSDSVVAIAAERLAILEQTQPLSDQFSEVHNDLEKWLVEMEKDVSMLTSPGLNAEQIIKQQENNERLMLLINKEKLVFDRLNKITTMFAPLLSRHDALYVKEIEDGLNERYNALKTDIRENQFALEKALTENSQFTDRLDNLLKTLINIEDEIKKSSEVSSSPQKLSLQMNDNANMIEDMKRREPLFTSVKTNGLEIVSGKPDDVATVEIKGKLSQLEKLYPSISNELDRREKSLSETFEIAEKFSLDYEAAITKLKDLKDSLNCQEPIATKPDEIQRQQEEFKEISQSLAPLEKEIDDVQKTGNQLILLISKSEQAELQKHLEEMILLLKFIKEAAEKRDKNLEKAFKIASKYNDTLDKINEFINITENKIIHFQPIGADLSVINDQIVECKNLRNDIDGNSQMLEDLHREQFEFKEIISPEEYKIIENEVLVIHKRREDLIFNINERKKQLDHALLESGYLEHVMNELLIWITKSQATLDQIKVIPGDDKVLEIELAKFKVISNDIEAHKGSLDNILTKISSQDSSPQQFQTLRDSRDKLQNSTVSKEKELNDELVAAQNFNAELQEILFWLNDIDEDTENLKATGGLPETSKDQLNKFQEIWNDVESNRPKVEKILSQGDHYVTKHKEMKVTLSNLQPTIRMLRQRWEMILSRISERKLKFEDSVKDSEQFNHQIESFKTWLTNSETKLSQFEPISSNTNKVQQQLQEADAIQKDLDNQREKLNELERNATNLKYFCQKQDFILISNYMISIQQRWENIISILTQRFSSLNSRIQVSKEFYDSWTTIMTWLREIEVQLQSMQSSAETEKDPVKIKNQLAEIKNLNHLISNRQSDYDLTVQSGKNLATKGTQDDGAEINRMLNELKILWQTICIRITEIQRILESNLMLSGQLSEALKAALEWLGKARIYLTQMNVFGDIEVVEHLYERHRRFEADVENRSNQIENLIQSQKSLSSPSDIEDLNKVKEGWTYVTENTKLKRQVLDEATKDAEQMQISYNQLMEWFVYAEKYLKSLPPIPAEEQALKQFQSNFELFLNDYRQKEFEKTEALAIAENILKQAHPEAIRVVQIIISTIIQRWEQISQWIITRETKITTYLSSFKDIDGSVDILFTWLSELEEKLVSWELEDLPNEIPVTEGIMEQHKKLMEETALRQSEIDNICKPKRLKPTTTTSIKSTRNFSLRSTSSRLPARYEFYSFVLYFKFN